MGKDPQAANPQMAFAHKPKSQDYDNQEEPLKSFNPQKSNNQYQIQEKTTKNDKRNYKQIKTR